MSLLISSDKLISSSDARKSFGKLLKTVAKEGYYVILENGKIRAFLVNPELLKDENLFPSGKELRKWGRYTDEISEALEDIEKLDPSDLPDLLK
ncbi:hypothetical protein A2974_00225 [Candidatus Peregrinibacteria bacterium RIFCSPLOWO2_01_FULL_48_20]|nr:MAG: hypothetical protein A2974_00225 [Candidatus Peregrinibacteria bacterium RIFCSPLOWO2_01_FULL_48_20]